MTSVGHHTERDVGGATLAARLPAYHQHRQVLSLCVPLSKMNGLNALPVPLPRMNGLNALSAAQFRIHLRSCGLSMDLQAVGYHEAFAAHSIVDTANS